jgi:hypothetical protein
MEHKYRRDVLDIIEERTLHSSVKPVLVAGELGGANGGLQAVTSWSNLEWPLSEFIRM